jgi:aminopeptidase N
MRPTILATLGLLAVFPIAVIAQRAPADALVPLMGKGVSVALANLRARTISDVRLRLTLDITSVDSARGSVDLRFRRTGDADALIDFRGRRLSQVTANGAAVASNAFNGSHLRVPASLLRAGENLVVAEFVTDIAPTGASIIRTRDRSDDTDYLYTLLVPADANQLFPCFDQPDLKVRLSLTLIAPREWTVVANGSLAHTDTVGSTVVSGFAETRPISTYLIAFAAGPWSRASSTVNGRTINAYVRRSRAREADLDSLLAANHRALAWMERYFDRPFPFDKFDFVLAPAFPFGGMEHPGAVFYNENSFIFRERPTRPRLIGRNSTILHEVAHQWFGDLVTMRWFDDLWLKEGFATYVAAKAQNELDSASGAWKTFYQSNKPAAYGVDQTLGTNPLWQKLENLDQAKSNYGAIVYNKAPAVLKQLNYLVGEGAFQGGIRSFLREHAYANATWQDLLGAVGKAANRPMDAFGRNFMLRPGLAYVEQRITLRDGKIANLTLVQRPAQTVVSGDAAWPMRTQLILVYPDKPVVRLSVELNARETSVAAARGLPAPAFAFPNADDYGYFLSILDSASVQSLEQGALGAVNDPFLRAMLWGSLWDQVRDARFNPRRWIRLALSELPSERDEQIAPRVLANLERAMKAYLDDDARSCTRPEVERMLWSMASDASRPYGLRKPFLDAFVQVAATADGVSKLESLLSADSAAGDALMDPTRWEVVTRLMVLNAASARRLLDGQVARDSSPDGRRRAFVAGAAQRSAEAKAEYFQRYFGDASLNEEWASGSLGAFNAAEHAHLTLRYLRPALDSLSYVQANRRIFFLGSWLGSFVGGRSDREALVTVKAFLAKHPKLARDLRQKVLQASDELERAVRVRARWN